MNLTSVAINKPVQEYIFTGFQLRVARLMLGNDGIGKVALMLREIASPFIHTRAGQRLRLFLNAQHYCLNGPMETLESR